MHGILLFLSVLMPVAGSQPLRESSSPADVGEIPSNKPLIHVFELLNNGPKAIVIRDVRKSCSCSKIEFDPKPVEPGHKTSIKVSLNLSAQPAGPGKWAVTVDYGSIDRDEKFELPLVVSGKVRRDVWTDPVSLVMAGESNLTAVVSVFDRRRNQLNVTGARMGSEKANVTILPFTKGEQRQSVRIGIDESLAIGSYLDELSIDTDDPEYRELKIPVRIVKKKADDSIRASVSTISLRGVGANKLVTLRDKEDREIEIESLVSDEPALLLKWAKGPGSDATIRVTLDSKVSARSGVSTVTVKTKLPVARIINITAEWSK